LPPDMSKYVALTFSPDGNSLYFVRSDPKDIGFRNLFQIPTLGGIPRKLVTDVDSGVSFSPDGRRIAFERWLASKNEGELRIAYADGSGERLLARFNDIDMESKGDPPPDWSSDGRTIIFSKFLLGAKRKGVIYAVSSENGSIKELYTTDNPLGRPMVSIGERLARPAV
jgi:Tol biopolymer transport system component